MLQHDEPDDFVIATNQTNTVRECVQVAFDEAGLSDWEQYVEIDPQFVRPPRSTSSSAPTTRPSGCWAGSRRRRSRTSSGS
jgi:GDP-D-mannose dehydratase